MANPAFAGNRQTDISLKELDLFAQKSGRGARINRWLRQLLRSANVGHPGSRLFSPVAE
jgi:hypothetical protein